MSVIVTLLRLQAHRYDLQWIALGICSTASLLFTASRSLLLVPLIAFVLLYIERKRPSFLVLFLGLLAALVAIGLMAQFRDTHSHSGRNASSGPDNWFEYTDLAFQTGPRVLTLAIDALDDDEWDGKLLISDFPIVGKFLFSDGAMLKSGDFIASDRLVTDLIGRNQSEVGGSPPTIFGGFFIDFRWLGVTVGSFIVGLVLTLSRSRLYSRTTLPVAVWFSYITTYVIISGYGYISIRPSWAIVLVACIGAQMSIKEMNDPDMITYVVM